MTMNAISRRAMLQAAGAAAALLALGNKVRPHVFFTGPALTDPSVF
ncbi:twin-arginine translocation signal domain-containing protein [Paracoccus sp. MA]|nr:twin-arginine translocation signal domain-containing protein [Paracoccus sp. MA]UFM66570.1 twin-arginine translocation signal domain-containing protein [Paracoccus sp. MA]